MSRISISKPVLLLGAVIAIVILAVGSVGYIEGVWNDPAGQLNNPLTFTCHQGILASRSVPLFDDGEYNWMFAKGQKLSVTVTLENKTDTSTIHLYLVQWAGHARFLDNRTIDRIHSQVNLEYTIQAAGHYQIELVNSQRETATWLTINATASSIKNNALWNCFNPGDLFHSD